MYNNNKKQKKTKKLIVEAYIYSVHIHTKLNRAFFFSDGRFTPCSADQQGAFVVKLSDLPPDKVSVMVVIQSVSGGP